MIGKHNGICLRSMVCWILKGGGCPRNCLSKKKNQVLIRMGTSNGGGFSEKEVKGTEDMRGFRVRCFLSGRGGQCLPWDLRLPVLFQEAVPSPRGGREHWQRPSPSASPGEGPAGEAAGSWQGSQLAPRWTPWEAGDASPVIRSRSWGAAMGGSPEIGDLW